MTSKPKWWDCESPETTPKDVEWGKEDSHRFQVFSTEEGWYFWDHNNSQCFGPLESEAEANDARDNFAEFCYPSLYNPKVALVQR